MMIKLLLHIFLLKVTSMAFINKSLLCMQEMNPVQADIMKTDDYEYDLLPLLASLLGPSYFSLHLCPRTST